MIELEQANKWYRSKGINTFIADMNLYVIVNDQEIMIHDDEVLHVANKQMKLP
tara:strand:- start:550 stop:708 length:159 start_codon:yes stop_codon:yes gene_type:complete